MYRFANFSDAKAQLIDDRDEMKPFFRAEGFTFYTNMDVITRWVEWANSEGADVYGLAKMSTDDSIYTGFLQSIEAYARYFTVHGVNENEQKIISMDKWQREPEGRISRQRALSDGIIAAICESLWYNLPEADLSSQGIHELLLMDAIKTVAGNTEKVVEKIVEVEKPSNPAQDLQTMLMQSFTDMVSGQFASKVVEDTYPKVEQMIINEFGMKPQRHEVVTVDDSHIIDGVVHKKFDTVMNLVANKIPAYLYGRAGTGKNVLVKQVADALGLAFHAMNSVTDEFKITGFVDANGSYHESEFYRAFTEGGVFFLDEMDASSPEVLVCLNMAIANGYFVFPHCGKVEAHPDFRVVAAGNTLGTGADALYTGRLQLDAATLNRFAVVKVDYDERIDEAMADGDKDLLEFIHNFRDAIDTLHVDAVASYRNVKMLKVMEAFTDRTEAIESCLTKSLNKDDIKQMYSELAIYTMESNPWMIALKKAEALA